MESSIYRIEQLGKSYSANLILNPWDPLALYLILVFIDIYCKYAWLVPLKDKKGVTISKDFQKILDKSGWKPKKYINR